MADVARFSGCTRNFVLFALAVLSVKAACAAPGGDGQPKMDCKVYQQQEQMKILRADPSLQDERLDTVFYSAKRNSCLASIFFTKGTVTYGGILDIADGQMLWAKSYKGTSFTPAHIVEIDQEIDDQIKRIELAPDGDDHSRSADFLPELFDRTMNKFPALRNALAEVR
jgi:hypothetical protein